MEATPREDEQARNQPGRSDLSPSSRRPPFVLDLTQDSVFSGNLTFALTFMIYKER